MRERIKEALGNTVKTNYYPQILSYLNNPEAGEWFQGAIQSLYFRPNNMLLVLEGDVGELNQFVEDLCLPGTYSYDNQKTDMIYESTIFNLAEWGQRHNMLLINDDFKIMNSERYPYNVKVHKRLASYITTTDRWHLPQGKRVIVCKPTTEYNSFNSEDLWSEIFQIYKPI